MNIHWVRKIPAPPQKPFATNWKAHFVMAPFVDVINECPFFIKTTKLMHS